MNKIANDSRTARQNQLSSLIEKYNFNGTIEAATGFGKTRVGILSIQRFRVKNPHSRIAIIVPTIDLSLQWQMLLTYNDILNVDVYIINTAYKLEKQYDFYVLDEAHRYAAPKFSNIFISIGAKPTLMLTATIKRSDGREKILLYKAPMLDRVPLEECLAKGWVSQYTVYNLAVPFTTEEQIAYSKADNSFRQCASVIGNIDDALNLLKTGTQEQKRIAYTFMKYMRLRKSLCQLSKNNLEYALKCIDRFKTRRTIVFSENIEFANSLYNAIPDKTVVLHSKLNKKERESVKQRFIKNKSLKVLSTVRAANEGIDIPNLSLAIIASGNSQTRDMIQRIGRTIRSVKNKHAIIINLYVPNTQAQVWLTKALKDIKNVDIKWITDLNEISYSK